MLPAVAFDCPGGGSLDLGRAPGVPTVVNLWGSWCPPCREEMPVLQQFADAAGDRVRVVGVISKDGLPQADSFAADAGVRFPSAFDGQGELMADLGLNVLPYTYFLDADGALAYTQVGPVTSRGRAPRAGRRAPGGAAVSTAEPRRRRPARLPPAGWSTPPRTSRCGTACPSRRRRPAARPS